MDKELCFIIENKALFFEKVLITFNEFPTFFICVDACQKYYLVCCKDTETLEYIITKTAKSTIYDMLIQKLSIRKAFLRQCEYWRVLAGTRISDDKVQKLDFAELDVSFLPNDDVYYEAKNASDINYITKMADST